MTETPTRLSSVVERLERRIRAEAIMRRVIDHFSIGPNEMGALMDELNVDRAITEFRGIPIVSSRAEGIRTLYRTRPSAPAIQTGRERVAQIILDEMNRQGLSVGGPIDLLAIVDALVAAAPPEQNAYMPPEMLTEVSKLWELSDPFDGSVTRIESWPEGLVLWYDGQIAWRSWGPPAPRPDHRADNGELPHPSKGERP